jgi:hypothetical protein
MALPRGLDHPARLVQRAGGFHRRSRRHREESFGELDHVRRRLIRTRGGNRNEGFCFQMPSPAYTPRPA